MKILIIEDEAPLREEIVDWLTFEGYESVGAENGEIGIACALRDLPDLILCDVTMPYLDGYSVLLGVRANPATAATAFVFMTARATHEDIRKGMISGADDYITKPFTREELLQTIQARLDKKSALSEEHERKVEQIQQALAEEQERSLLKAQLVAMYSHDFRNPLTAIQSSSSLLSEYWDRLTETRRKTLFGQIESSVQVLQQMVDDMLTVAQMETGHLILSPEPMDVNLFVQNLVDEFQLARGATHQFTFESNVSGSVDVDARVFRQIATNLISNAAKYSPRGSEVHVNLTGDDGHFTLCVKDQGIGISQEDQGRLFKVFERGENVGKTPGTGLGLAIVQQAVETLGGSLELESEVGQGTSVSVTIPLGE
jgi:signal transduction histidine kinase